MRSSTNMCFRVNSRQVVTWGNSNFGGDAQLQQPTQHSHVSARWAPKQGLHDSEPRPAWDRFHHCLWTSICCPAACSSSIGVWKFHSSPLMVWFSAFRSASVSCSEAMAVSSHGAIRLRAVTAPYLTQRKESKLLFWHLCHLGASSFSSLSAARIGGCFCGPHDGRQRGTWRAASKLFYIRQGRVLTWGNHAFGGDCSAVSDQLTEAWARILFS